MDCNSKDIVKQLPRPSKKNYYTKRRKEIRFWKHNKKRKQMILKNEISFEEDVVPNEKVSFLEEDLPKTLKNTNLWEKKVFFLENVLLGEMANCKFKGKVFCKMLEHCNDGIHYRGRSDSFSNFLWQFRTSNEEEYNKVKAGVKKFHPINVEWKFPSKKNLKRLAKKLTFF